MVPFACEGQSATSNALLSDATKGCAPRMYVSTIEPLCAVCRFKLQHANAITEQQPP